jgi:hypothetical protein
MIIFVLGVIDIPASLSWRAGDALLAQVWKKGGDLPSQNV